MTREEAIDIIKCLAWHTIRPDEEDIEQAIKALKQEPILDNCIEIPECATNGDMFVAVWGYAPSQLRAQVDWWNAPYKKGDKEK